MTRFLLFLSAAGLLLVAGCRKDDIVNCAPSTSSLSLADFTRRNAPPVQVFTLVLGPTVAAQDITTSGGAKFSFPATQFLLPTGTPATGTAQVRIREIYTVADMVLANMPTTIGRQGNMLVSGGEFNIQVWQNATRLRLATSQMVAVQSPIPTGQDTTSQYVWQQLATSLPKDSTGWQRANAPAVQKLPNLYRASLPLDSIGWWNIDQFWHAYNTAATAKVLVRTTANPPTETRVYLRPIGFNGLARLGAVTLASTNTDWQGVLPVGADMVAVVLQSINGQLYYGTQRVTVSNGLVVTPVLTAVSEAEAVRLIRQL